MNGPQHYRLAEAALDRANGTGLTERIEHYLTAVAQVHATLALAAATVDVAIDPVNGPDWREVTR